VRTRANRAFETAYDVLNGLETVQNRRKAVLYVSNGYDFSPFAGARAGTDKVFGGRYGSPVLSVPENSADNLNPFFDGHQQFSDADLAQRMLELTRAANRANAAIYSIDPRGLMGTTDAGQQIDISEWNTHLQKTQSTLRFLANETGGFAVVNQNDYESAIKQIDAATSDYYVIGYYSSNADPTQRVRRLEVRVKRPGVSALSRRAYSIRPTEKVRPRAGG
jgi:VWFA-related protein